MSAGVAKLTRGLRFLKWGILPCVWISAATAQPHLFSAGTRGRIYPCATCHKQKPTGGLLHAGPGIRTHLEQGPAAAWFDLGNAFTGGDLSPDQASVLPGIYRDLGVSAMNVSAGDFRHGFEFLQSLLAESGLPLVSANLVWADSKDLLYPATLTLSEGDSRLTIVGLTEPPTGLTLLPQLRKQYEGVDFLDPGQALKNQLEALPKDAKVGVLYDGSEAGLMKVLRAAEGVDPERLWIAAPASSVRALPGQPSPVRLIPVVEDGTGLTRLSPGADPAVQEIPITAEGEPDAAILKRLREKGVPEPGGVGEGSGKAGEGAAPEGLDLESLQNGEELTFLRQTSNRGLRVAVHGLSVHSRIGGTPAAPGKQFLVAQVSFENRQAVDLLLEKNYPEPLLVGELKSQLFLKVNHRVVAGMADPTPESASALPQKFTLTRAGSQARGQVVFEIPDIAISALSLVYVPEKFPALEVRLTEDDPKPAGDAVAAGTSEGFLTLRVEGFEVVESYRDVSAPEGMRWAVVDLYGSSRFMRTLDARAVDAEAEAEAKVEAPRAVVYLKAPDLLQMVVDGRHAYVRNPRLSAIAPEPAFPSRDPLGGTAVFPVPADAASIELHADFPAFRDTDGTRNPEAIRLTLLKAEEPIDSPPILARIDDTPLPLTVDWVNHDRQGNRVRVGVTLRNTGDEGGMYQASTRANLLLPDGSTLSPVAVEGKGGVPMREPFWIPAGYLPRSFTYVFQAPDEASTVRFSYGGVTKTGNVTVDLTRAEADGSLAATGVETREGGAGAGLETRRLLDSAFVPSSSPPSVVLDAAAWNAPEKADKDEVVIQPPGDGIPVNRSVRGDGFTLAAQRMFMLDAYYGEEMDEGTRLLAVEVELTRRPDAGGKVEITDVEDILLLRINGRRLKGMRRFGGSDPQLPNEIVLDDETPAIRNFVFYEVPADGLSVVELVLAERGRSPERLRLIPVDGEPPPGPEPLREAENRVASLGLYSAEVRETFLGRPASNDAWLVVDLRGHSRLTSAPPAEGGGGGDPLRLVWRGWRPRMQLILDGTRSVHMQRNDDDFDGEARLLSGLTSGGLFGFDVSSTELEAAQTIQLQCGFEPEAIPGHRVVAPETLYFTLKGDPADLPPPPEPMLALEDLNFKLDVIRAHRPEQVNDRTPGAGASWLRVELGVTGLAESGVWFDPREFLNLLSPGRSVISTHRYSWRGADAPPDSGRSIWIPEGGRREFRLVWEVKDEVGPVRLRVNGVKHFRALTLFPEEDDAAPGVADPEANPLISEQGIQVLNPGMEVGGIAGAGLTPAQVNQAIDRGRDYLWEVLRQDLTGAGARRSYQGKHYLAMLALVHCDAHLTFPEFDRELRRFLRETRIENNTVYENALVAMTIEGYGDPTFLPKMEQVAHWLVETQGEGGTWSYQAPVPSRFFPRPEPAPEVADTFLKIAGGERREPYEALAEPIHRTQPWALGKDGDHSCTQFAVLGLWSAERSGVPIDDEVWERVLTRMSLHQTLGREDQYGGFGYRGKGGVYGSMTGAGICVLAIAMDRLFDDVTPREHLRIRNALGWMVRNFNVQVNPDTKKYNFYYLYSIERVGQILGIEFMGDREWYPLGAKYLVGAQNGDGSWPAGPGESEPVLTTSYALLFLTRATPELDAEAKPEPSGPGKLATAVERPDIRHQVYLILDASGSMRPEIGGKRKLDIARDAVGELLDVLPEQTRVAVRAYGHRKRAVEPGAEEDTELVVPWTDLDPAGIRKKLETLRPMGKTPMALSLKAASGEIRGGGEGKTLLILLTDGGEDNRDTDPVAAAAAFAGREDVEFFVLGFDINRPDWTRQLEAMAEAGNGVYRPVNDASALARDLRAVVYPPVPDFQVLDQDRTLVATGGFGGEPMELKEGDYTLRTVNPPYSADFHIRAGGTTRITLDMANLPKTDAPPGPVVEAEEPGPVEAPASDGPGFCTQCGSKLASGAKFCTGCGNPVR